MKDLLPSVAGSVREQSTENGTEGVDVETGTQNTEEALPLPRSTAPSGRNAQLDQFFRDVSDIKVLLENIKSRQDDIKAVQEKSKASTRNADAKQFADEMTMGVEEVNKTALMVKKRLEGLDTTNAEAATVPGNEPGTSNERMRSAVTVGLKKKLKDLMAEFGQLRQKIQEEHRDSVGRKMYTVTGRKATDDEVDKVIETGQSDRIYQRGLMEPGKGHVLDTLAEIQERHEAVKQLEKSLLELNQIFRDMAVLVEAQGEKLDNIESQVAKAMEYVAKGTEQLVEARELQKDSQKWMCYSIICIVVVLVIIAAIIAFQVM